MMGNIRDKKFLTLGLALLVAPWLNGCSSEPTIYSGVDAVLAAYNEGGDDCGSPEPIPSFNNDFGIYGLKCASGDALIWFADDKAKSDWLDLVTGAGEPHVLGTNWMVLTSNFDRVTASMGGTPSS